MATSRIKSRCKVKPCTFIRFQVIFVAAHCELSFLFSLFLLNCPCDPTKVMNKVSLCLILQLL